MGDPIYPDGLRRARVRQPRQDTRTPCRGPIGRAYRVLLHVLHVGRQDFSQERRLGPGRQAQEET